MNIELLDKLVARIKRQPDDKVNMTDVWAKTDCGSVGCAMGHAAHMGVFNKEGLTWNNRFKSLELYGKQIAYDDAAVAVFGMKFSHVYDLFAPRNSSEVMMGLTHKQAFLKRVKEFKENYA